MKYCGLFCSMNKAEAESLINVLNSLKHETLAHKVFQKCFRDAVKSEEIRGLEKSSLFRSTLAYFLLVSNAREKFLAELKQIEL